MMCNNASKRVTTSSPFPTLRPPPQKKNCEADIRNESTNQSVISLAICVRALWCCVYRTFSILKLTTRNDIDTIIIIAQFFNN